MTLALALSLSLSLSLALGGETAVDAGLGPPLQRLGFLVAADAGGPGRPRLRYTADDVAAVAAVLTGLGAFAPSDVHTLLDADLARLEDALVAFDADVRAAHDQGARVEVVVYYSGHSDADGLLLGDGALPWEQLRKRVADFGADVSVVILDSCSSGALVRKKGGVHRPPFALTDGGVRGHAYLTSSRDDEPAQESDRIGGSFFTNALVTGLRGAADSSADGRVTLNEAYAFAFEETLQRTELAASGAQHPAYDIQLQGSGDWVVTDLRDFSAGLVVGDDVAGRVLVRDARGRLMAELQKRGGSVVLGLPPGVYDVRVLQKGAAATAQLTLEKDRRVTLTRASLKDEGLLTTTARGTGAERSAEHFVFANVALVSPIESNAIVNGAVENALGLHLVQGFQQRLSGVDLSLGVNVVGADARGAVVAVAANIVGGDLEGVGVGAVGNVVGGDLAGVAIGAVTNVVAGHAAGLSLSAGVNWAHGGFDVAQVAAGFNVGLGASRGLALAPVNIHDALAGAQIGVINIGADVGGAQVGVINIAGSVSGAQVGVVNVAGHSDVSVGVLSFVGDGQHSVGLMSTDLTPLSLVTRLGSRSVYGVVGFGVSPWFEDKRTNLQLTVGPGVWFPVDVAGLQMGLRIEAVTGPMEPAERLFVNSGSSLVSTARVLGTWQITDLFAVYGGPALNVGVVDSDREIFAPFGFSFVGDSVTTTLSPGLAVGVQLF